MGNRFFVVTLAFVLIIAATLTGIASATTRYAITNLGPGSGEEINSSGQVTGFIYAQDGFNTSFSMMATCTTWASLV